MTNYISLSEKILLENNIYKYIKEYLDFLKTVSERKDFHPEENVYTHILIVLSKVLYNKSIDNYDRTILIYSAILHDIGKAVTYKNYNNSYGHEKHSYNISKDILENINDIDEQQKNSVLWIIDNHTRVNKIHEMRNAKKLALTENPNFKLLQLFTQCDDMTNNDIYLAE